MPIENDVVTNHLVLYNFQSTSNLMDDICQVWLVEEVGGRIEALAEAEGVEGRGAVAVAVTCQGGLENIRLHLWLF